ncbi:hypothetical protein [Sedimentibacter sp. B4]|uniref:hypothetical protein n=1 Tax=Sedimentibacter sp. B4 TaxID=304766 RepID=UPI0002F34F51|nr:hypothetical protein [Sedimentibacter sp. B4]
MLFSNMNYKTRTLKIISLSLTLAGIIFILAAEYIGSIAIRLAMLSVLVYNLVNIKMTYKYLKTKEKINYAALVTAAVLGLFRPELIMFITGILLLILTVPIYFNAIRKSDYSDVIMLIISGAGILFASYCIINSKAALNTVIIIIGIAMTILGCLSLFEALYSKTDDKGSDSGDNIEHTFENITDK